MANYPIVITLDGDEAVMIPCLDAFVKQSGWTETVRSVIQGQPSEEIANPETKLMCARRVIRAFITNQVMQYNKKMAAEQAVAAVQAQVDAALDTTTMTVTAGE